MVKFKFGEQLIHESFTKIIFKNGMVLSLPQNLTRRMQNLAFKSMLSGKILSPKLMRLNSCFKFDGRFALPCITADGADSEAAVRLDDSSIVALFDISSSSTSNVVSRSNKAEPIISILKLAKF